MTPRKMKVRFHTKSTVGTNINGTETQTPESVGTLELGSKPSMALENQLRLLRIFPCESWLHLGSLFVVIY